jgi:hypothetical protein
VDLETVLCARPGHLSTRVGGETAILDCGQGVYFGVNATGTRVWDLLQEPVRVGEVLDRLVDEFEVAPERCQQDVMAFLVHLLQAGLVEVRVEKLGAPEPSVRR